jgi:hypothetical protein
MEKNDENYRMSSKCWKSSVADRYVMIELFFVRVRILMRQMVDKKINCKWERLIVSDQPEGGRRTIRRWFERLIVSATSEIYWSMRYSSFRSYKATSVKRMSYDVKWNTKYTRTETLKPFKLVYMLAYKKSYSRLKENIIWHQSMIIIFWTFHMKFLHHGSL